MACGQHGNLKTSCLQIANDAFLRTPDLPCVPDYSGAKKRKLAQKQLGRSPAKDPEASIPKPTATEAAYASPGTPGTEVA